MHYPTNESSISFYHLKLIHRITINLIVTVYNAIIYKLCRLQWLVEFVSKLLLLFRPRPNKGLPALMFQRDKQGISVIPTRLYNQDKPCMPSQMLVNVGTIVGWWRLISVN